jgi:hypothetical protein
MLVFGVVGFGVDLDGQSRRFLLNTNQFNIKSDRRKIRNVKYHQ